MFTNDIFGLPTGANPMDMMNSELIQKTMLGGQSATNDRDFSKSGFPDFSPAFEKPKLSWIEWFCSLEGHEFLLKVDAEFIKDKMNLICLNDRTLGITFDKKRMADCMRLLLAKTQPSEEDLQNEQFLQLN